MRYEMWCPVCNHEWTEQEENNNCYECPKCHSDRVYRDRLVDCNCGEEVSCSGFTNQCEKCGALYNAFGERLASSSEWDDEDRYVCFGPQNNY